MKNKKDLCGIIPAMMTIFDENENIDKKRTFDFIDFLIDSKVNGLYITGSTGEGFLMTDGERKQVAEMVIKYVDNRVPVIVHVGSIGTKKTIEIANHAKSIGCDYISSVPPFYWKFSNEDIINYYKDINDAVDIPMIVYNIANAGTMNTKLIKELSKLKNVIGVKYTLQSEYEICELKDDIEDFMVFSGCDELGLAGLYNGADGLIGSFYNLMPELYVNLYNAYRKGDFESAIKLQLDAARIIRLSVKYDYYSVMRLGLKWMGVDAGYSRRPFTNYSGAQEDSLKKEFVKLRDKYNITQAKFLKSI